jgi:hypothetical protein
VEVSSPLDRCVEFLEAQRRRHGPRFPEVRVEKVLTFMGTSSLAGGQPSVSLHRVAGVEAPSTPGALRVRLVGPMPRGPAPGECVTVLLTRFEQYRGYQVKSLPRVGDAAPAPEGLLGVDGRRIYTVHHGPYTLRSFERIPVDEVRDLAAGLPFVLVAVGPSANLSPRFVFHQEVRDGRLALFHGDGLALKTAMNLRTNPRESRVVLDLDRPGGWLLRGAVEPVREGQHPVAWEKVHAGFASGGWGRPAVVYRLLVDSLEPLALAG